MTFLPTALALEALDELQRHNRYDVSDEDSPRAKRTLLGGKARQRHVCLSTAAEGHRPALLSRINPPRKKAQKKHNLDSTDDKEDIQTHPVD